MRRRVARRGDRRHERVPESNRCSVRQGLVVELDPGSRREVGGRPRPLDEGRKTGDVIRLDMRLEHGDDRRADRVSSRQVVVHELGMRVDDRQLPVRRAAEQVARTRRRVVQEGAEQHRISSQAGVSTGRPARRHSG